jgi:hypothetical protein
MTLKRTLHRIKTINLKSRFGHASVAEVQPEMGATISHAQQNSFNLRGRM